MSEFLLPLLEFAPAQRATASQALRHPWLIERPSQPATPDAVPGHRQQQPQQRAEAASPEGSCPTAPAEAAPPLVNGSRRMSRWEPMPPLRGS